MRNRKNTDMASNMESCKSCGSKSNSLVMLFPLSQTNDQSLSLANERLNEQQQHSYKQTVQTCRLSNSLSKKHG